MNAVTLRNGLIVLLLLSIGAVGALIYYASGYLRAEAVKTSHAKIDVELIEADIDQLKILKQTLSLNQTSVDKARQIVSNSKEYVYQDQIINDINAYANATGVRVIGYDFGSVSTSTTKDPKKLNAPQINGVKAVTTTVMLASPMGFDEYLRFVKAIEQNLTKMQVSGVSLSPDQQKPSLVANSTVVIIVYVR